MNKKSIFWGVLIVIIAIIIGIGIGYVIRNNIVKNKLILPIYKVTQKNSDYESYEKEIVQTDNNKNNKYEMVNYIECMYDICYWHDYNVRNYARQWIYYDNNELDEGGYYIYDPKTNKTLSGPYKSIKNDIIYAEIYEDKKLLQGVYLYSQDNKVGYFELRDHHKLLLDAKYDEIEFDDNFDLWTTKSGQNYSLYYLSDHKLNKINDKVYDEISFVSDRYHEFAITKKDGKYNLIHSNGEGSYIETNDNYKFFNFFTTGNGMNYYFIYVSNGKTYISTTTFENLITKNTLQPDQLFNIELPINGDDAKYWDVEFNEDDNLLEILPSYDPVVMYVIDLNTNKIETIDLEVTPN